MGTRRGEGRGYFGYGESLAGSNPVVLFEGVYSPHPLIPVADVLNNGRSVLAPWRGDPDSKRCSHNQRARNDPVCIGWAVARREWVETDAANGAERRNPPFFAPP